jgi:YesN/AraC family two-component response regulator
LEVRVMVSLLIVDDERWVRQGLRTTIDWQTEGVEVLGEAEDGEEALHLILDRTPDIIITDIKMPRMDGLALIESVKNRNLSSKIIIISGYGEFSLAQKALRYGATDYVLKPVEETQVLDVVRKCVTQIHRETEEREQHIRMSECIQISLPLARQRYLETLLTKVSALNNDWRHLWDRLQLQLNPNRLKVIGVKVYDWGTKAAEEKGRSLVRYALANMAEEIVKPSGKTFVCPLDRHKDTDIAVLLSPCCENDGELLGVMEALIQAVRSHLGIGINIGISRTHEAPHLYEALSEAVHSGAYAFYRGYGKVYDASQLEPPQMLRLQEYRGPIGWDTRFAHALKMGRETAINEWIGELIAHVKTSGADYSPYQLHSGLTALFDDIWKKLVPGASPESIGASPLTFPFCTLQELEIELQAAARQVRQVLERLGNRKRFVELAIQFIEEHLTEPISMNGIAEQLYMNPSYFSKIFHEETGETFIKYVARLRIEKTKQLLKDSTLKIYEIAHQVGYQDFRYFVKLFKEQVGVTPAQYRNIGIL